MDNKINTDNATNTIVNDSQKRIDLHVHSDASDGTLSPESLVKYAYQAGLSAFALTDHDTVMGIPAAMSTGLPIKVIPGIELSAGYKNRDIHILGLFIDYKSKLLTEISQNALTERNQRNQKMINNLRNAGIPITMEDLYSHSEKNGAITRAHFARFLVDHGYAVDKNDAFAKYLSEDTPYYVKREYLTPEQCIQIIHECGGYSVLAHPILYNLPENELDCLVCRLKKAGLNAIETIYSTYTADDEAYVRSLADKYDLLISGGSDFHGSNKPDIDIGCGRGNLLIPYELLNQFI
ncbi:MAG: PHP domain-containing protein [Lachnoclostridium sp.]|nr:PHP domain-containing protein [Lachnoclostridium sp.]